KTIEDFGEEASLLLAEPAGNAEIDANDGPVGLDEKISGMHVGMEEAIAQRMPQEGLHQYRREPFQIVAGRREALHIRKLCSLDPFECQHVATRPRPIHSGNAEAWVVPDILADLGKRG